MPYRGRATRRGLRAAVAAVVVLVAGVVLAGVSAADPALLAGTPAAPAAGSLLTTPAVPADPDGFARDQGVPVPEVPPCLPTVRACVELAANHAWLLDNGRVVRGPVTVTPGDEDNPTPRGSFTSAGPQATWPRRPRGSPQACPPCQSRGSRRRTGPR